MTPADATGSGRFHRYEANPILCAEDLGFEANAVFNPGAVELPDGTTLLLVRVEDCRGLSSLYTVRSDDGFSGWKVDPEPLLAPDRAELAYEWGFEDARITYVAELDSYVITCTAYGTAGPCVYLARTRDFRTIDEGEVVLAPEDKNAAVFPRRIDGHWMLLHRPVVMARATADIWISRSEDLASWRHPERVMACRPPGWWDAVRIGIGPPPIETEQGWLLLYHGVRQTVSGSIYRVGAALLDLEDPTVVRGRLPEWLLGPAAPYERAGDVPNVVFPCGACVRDGVIRLYYGAADSCVAVATVGLQDVLDRF